MIATITKGLILTAWLLGLIAVIVGIVLAVKLFQDRNHRDRK